MAIRSLNVRAERPAPAFSLSVGLSTLCLVHCLLAPLVVAFMPFIAARMEAWERGEPLLLALSAGLAAHRLHCGSRVHGKRAGWLIWLVAVGVLAARRQETFAHLEGWLVAAGSLGMAASQLVDQRFCRACNQCAPAGVALAEIGPPR